MVKSKYFCDRCADEVASEYGLKTLVLARFGGNPLKMELCNPCTVLVEALVKPQIQIAGVVTT